MSPYNYFMADYQGSFEGGIRLTAYYTGEIVYSLRHPYGFLILPLYTVRTQQY